MEKRLILMAKGIEQVPKTLTTLKLLNLTLKPSFCKLLANLLAATLAICSLVAPVHVTLPLDHILAVVYGLRSFIVIIPFSRRYSTLMPFKAIWRRFRWQRTLKEHTTLFITISISGSDDWPFFSSVFKVSRLLWWRSCVLLPFKFWMPFSCTAVAIALNAFDHLSTHTTPKTNIHSFFIKTKTTKGAKFREKFRSKITKSRYFNESKHLLYCKKTLQNRFFHPKKGSNLIKFCTNLV